MEVTTFRHARGAWSHAFPALDAPSTLVLAFASPAYRDRADVFAALAAAYPRSTLIGCSSAGEIEGAELHDDSVTVAVIRFASTRVRRAETPIADALRDDDLRAVIVFSDGLATNGTELVRGLASRLPAQVVVTGGLAADGDRFAHTWVVTSDGPRANAVVAAGLYGDRLCATHGSQGGWDVFGPTRVVTAATGSVLYALDGRPALALYKEYLGERAAGLPGSALLFPLAVRDPAGSADGVVRTVLAVDEASQSLRFAGDIPLGHHAQLMRANFDRLILGAQAAALSALPLHPGPVLSLAISCVGRRLVLGARTEEELEVTLEPHAAGSKQIGFYAYGEISPRANGRSDLHNQTMTILALSEPT